MLPLWTGKGCDEQMARPPALGNPEEVARMSVFTATGQWLIVIGAAMVAIGLTYNSVLARQKAINGLPSQAATDNSVTPK